MTMVDDAGHKLSGASKYVIRFADGQLPPVNGFWSLTLYDPAFFFVANPLNRYTISPRNGLKTNSDGSTPLRAEHVAGTGQGIELAARPCRAVRPDDALLRPQQCHPRRLVELPPVVRNFWS